MHSTQHLEDCRSISLYRNEDVHSVCKLLKLTTEVDLLLAAVVKWCHNDGGSSSEWWYVLTDAELLKVLFYFIYYFPAFRGDLTYTDEMELNAYSQW